MQTQIHKVETGRQGHRNAKSELLTGFGLAGSEVLLQLLRLHGEQAGQHRLDLYIAH